MFAVLWGKNNKKGLGMYGEEDRIKKQLYILVVMWKVQASQIHGWEVMSVESWVEGHLHCAMP